MCFPGVTDGFNKCLRARRISCWNQTPESRSADTWARKRVPFQPVPHATTEDRDSPRTLSHRETDQNLVPESKDEVEEREQTHQLLVVSEWRRRGENKWVKETSKKSGKLSNRNTWKAMAENLIDLTKMRSLKKIACYHYKKIHILWDALSSKTDTIESPVLQILRLRPL